MQIDFARCDFGLEEINAVNRVLMGTWLASGPENEAFEKEFAEYVGANYSVCVNSGSSANLLALASLGLLPSTPVLTSSCGFPATLSPILHLGLKPVLVDYSDTFNINVADSIATLPFVKAVIFAHTLGNKVNSLLVEAAKHFNVPVIEDCCEAVGTKGIANGTLATWSFYPAHQMTALGGGGMVTTNDEELYKRMKSLRDWGKMYSWDSSLGGNNTDYSSHIGYHRGYTYDTVGWNFKLPEANCAFGREQIKKLDKFREIRYENWSYLNDKLKDHVSVSPMSDGASPFGFCMTHPKRNEFGMYLELKGIKHRPFFAGNILRQPAFKSDEAEKFPVADKLMREALFVGCHTKLKQKDLNYMVETIRAYADNS